MSNILMEYLIIAVVVITLIAVIAIVIIIRQISNKIDIFIGLAIDNGSIFSMEQAKAYDDYLATEKIRSDADNAAATAYATAHPTPVDDKGPSLTAYRKLGCYKDDEKRTLSNWDNQVNPWDTAKCFQIAKSKNHRYFARQNNTQCVTGSEDYARLGLSDVGCDYSDANLKDATYGKYVNDVYQIVG